MEIYGLKTRDWVKCRAFSKSIVLVVWGIQSLPLLLTPSIGKGKELQRCWGEVLTSSSFLIGKFVSECYSVGHGSIGEN